MEGERRVGQARIPKGVVDWCRDNWGGISSTRNGDVVEGRTEGAETADCAVRNRLEDGKTSRNEKTQHGRQYEQGKFQSDDSGRCRQKDDCLSDPSF